jgi:outer membrane protein OmpA-like peptidoglycan-associated protein
MRSATKLTLFAWVVAVGVTFTAAQDSQQTSGSVINISVSRSIQAVNYWSRGSTKVGFIGTALMPRADGEAKVEAKGGSLTITAEFKGLESPGSFGPAYLVYVLWGITPEGRANNLGQVVVKEGKGQIQVTTKLQSFGMIVTAEPYFAVNAPSDEVVLENKIRSDTQGAVVNVGTQLLQRGRYDDAHLEAFAVDPKVPLDLYQARNAVRIAKWQKAEQYAPEAFAKAQAALAQAEDYQKRKQKNSVPTVARGAVQAAEDSITLSVRRQREEEIANQQKAAQEAQDAEARKRAQAEANERQQAQARAEAEAATAKEAQARAEAEAAAAKEAQARGQAEEQAQRERDAAAQSEREKQELRARLLDQFNRVLPTTDTPRGLVVNMGDVLFDTAKADLRPGAREALAKLSGIVLNYPTLQLTIEGHTDSTGTEEFNQKLSEKRASNVRDYLVGQGLSADSIVSKGMGQQMPVADNATAQGRQKNRRVEIIVAGEVIGSKIGSASPASQTPPQ